MKITNQGMGKNVEDAGKVPYLVQRTRTQVVVKVSGEEKVIAIYTAAEDSDNAADAKLAEHGFERDMVWTESMEPPRRWTSARKLAKA